MNGMDNILRRIREDAQREMDAMQQEALEKREAILARGREQSERLLAEGRQKNLQLAEGRKARLISAANMESRQVLLYNKQKHCVAKARLYVFHIHGRNIRLCEIRLPVQGTHSKFGVQDNSNGI